MEPMETPELDAVADGLREEFGGWIAGHPNAGLFDWQAAAENVLRATDHRGAVEAAEKVIAEWDKWLADGTTEWGSDALADAIRDLRIAVGGGS